MSTQRVTRERSNGAGPALWFGLLGGAAAWAAQFLSGYLISEGVCVGAVVNGAGTAGDLGTGALGASVGAGIGAIAVVSAAAFAVAVLAALAGRRVWLREREVHDGGRGWVGLAGFALSSVFAFIIVVQVFPLFTGGGCS